MNSIVTTAVSVSALCSANRGKPQYNNKTVIMNAGYVLLRVSAKIGNNFTASTFTVFIYSLWSLGLFLYILNLLIKLKMFTQSHRQTLSCQCHFMYRAYEVLSAHPTTACFQLMGTCKERPIHLHSE